jgi:hypothetical protein
MAVLVSEGDETATLENINESLDHEREAQAETKQLLVDLKDKEAVALEIIAIRRGYEAPMPGTTGKQRGKYSPRSSRDVPSRSRACVAARTA